MLNSSSAHCSVLSGQKQHVSRRNSCDSWILLLQHRPTPCWRPPPQFCLEGKQRRGMPTENFQALKWRPMPLLCLLKPLARPRRGLTAREDGVAGAHLVTPWRSSPFSNIEKGRRWERLLLPKSPSCLWALGISCGRRRA